MQDTTPKILISTRSGDQTETLAELDLGTLLKPRPETPSTSAAGPDKAVSTSQITKPPSTPAPATAPQRTTIQPEPNARRGYRVLALDEKHYQRFVDREEAYPVYVGMIFQNVLLAYSSLGLNPYRYVIEAGLHTDQKRIEEQAATKGSTTPIRPTVTIRGVTLGYDEPVENKG
jgi:hypothetical protein